MNPHTDTTPGIGDVVNGAGDGIVALGLLTMTLFPWAIPGIALAVAVAVPLVLAAAVLGLLAAVLAAPFVAVRRLRRRPARIAQTARGRIAAPVDG
jgi:hypothetical protein